MAVVATLPVTTSIYSNAPEAIYFQTGRMALRIPSSYQSANRRPNPDFASEMSAMGAQLQTGQAVIVWFDAGERGSMPEEAELVQEFSLQPLAEAPDGTILARATSP